VNTEPRRDGKIMAMLDNKAPTQAQLRARSVLKEFERLGADLDAPMMPRARRDLMWDDQPHCRDCEPKLFPASLEGSHHFAVQFGWMANPPHPDIVPVPYLDDVLQPYAPEALCGELGEIFIWAIDDIANGRCEPHKRFLERRVIGNVRVSTLCPEVGDEVPS
jgi:hypothetical protein